MTITCTKQQALHKQYKNDSNLHKTKAIILIILETYPGLIIHRFPHLPSLPGRGVALDRMDFSFFTKGSFWPFLGIENCVIGEIHAVNQTVDM